MGWLIKYILVSYGISVYKIGSPLFTNVTCRWDGPVPCLVLSWGLLGITSRWSMWTEEGADCYSQYGASWTLAASSRLAPDGCRDEEGGGRSLLLNWLMVSELTVSRCSKFYSGIVLGKKECLYGSVEVRIVLYLNWWEDLVLKSALSNKSWWGTDMISWMILKSRARRICFRLSFNCCQPRSDNIWVTLLRGPKLWHTKRAAHRCTRSSLLISYSWCGSHVPAAYSNFDLSKLI